MDTGFRRRYELHHGELVEFGFRVLPEYEWRIADIVPVERERWDGLPENGYFNDSPVLVIEVQRLCLENGAREFWVVDPRRNQVKVSTREGRSVTYASGQQIPLFFDGAIAVDDIFVN